MRKITRAKAMAKKIKDRITELIDEKELKAKEAYEKAYKFRVNGNYEEAGERYADLSCILSEIDGLRSARMVAIIAAAGK
jgi:hypothetical protein